MVTSVNNANLFKVLLWAGFMSIYMHPCESILPLNMVVSFCFITIEYDSPILKLKSFEVKVNLSTKSKPSFLYTSLLPTLTKKDKFPPVPLSVKW